MTKKLLMGNEAFAHAALEAGVRVVAGYPGTPSSELIETVAKLHASVVTTICVSAGVSASVFTPLKTLSKFLIVMAMCAVGLNTNIVKLVKTGGKPLIMGFCCWVGIAGMSLLMQHVLGIW